jgi:uncharacterized protein (DUF305 family)
MWKRTLVTGTAALAALVIAAGCSSNNSASEQASGQSTTATSATTSPGGEAHNQADVMFAQHMIPHHQQAIEMSDIVLAKQGIDPRVTDLANQIKAAQGPEIQQMQGWLTQWGSPQMPMPSGMPGHGDMPGMSGMPGMTGMMSEQDMAALQNAQGVEASKLFLTQMIAHHEGAITMGQNEIKDGRYPATIELAQSIVTSQQKEIETMKGILATL